MPSAIIDNVEFPLDGLCPKKEIQGDQFIQQYPKYDGRGIVVAIFDTGIDVGAPGLNGLTSDGSYKMIDAVDCSGSGDVDCKTVVTADEDGVITGKSGRKLRIDPAWKELNPSGQYHIGLKSIFDLFPGVLTDRVKEERKKKFQKKQNEMLSSIKEKANALATSKDEVSKKQASEYEKQLNILADLMKTYEDTGYALDCVVFLDSKTNIWRAVVVSDSHDLIDNVFSEPEGEDYIVDLSKQKLLCDFKLEHQHGTFSELDLMNYTINVYENGNLLSIVTPAGSHGTHVGAIVGAHFPDKPELNGVAPGVQLVSVKIGDTRLGSMETGTALNRGLISCYLNKCSIINMSYGEPCSLSAGIFKEKLEELVYEHNVAFITSAGNSGPNWTSCGAPASISDACIGIGAYVTNSMIRAQYGLSQVVPDSQFSWSSRGPTEDGGICPRVSGLGASIASVPCYTLQKLMRMNGTSMSSPNIAGALALLYSAMLAEGKQWNPFYTRKVLENTAKSNFDAERKTREEHDHHPLAIGRGLVQVLDAYNFICQHPYNPETDNYRIEITIPSRNNARGIYLREEEETHNNQLCSVHINLKYNQKANQSKKVEFEKRLKLVPVIYNGSGDSVISEEKKKDIPQFIKAPEYLHIPGCSSFDVAVETSILEENNIYSARLDAYDCDNLSFGPLFSVPITVMKPFKLSSSMSNIFNYDLESGDLRRQYITPPSCDIQYCKVTLHSNQMDSQNIVCLHTTQLLEKESHALYDNRKFIHMSETDSSIHYFKTVPNRTMELTVGLFWSAVGKTNITVDLEFFGIDSMSCVNNELLFDGSDVGKKLQISSPLRNMELAISGKLDGWKEVISPTNSDDNTSIEIQNDSRNTYFDSGKCSYQLILEYALKMSSEHEIVPSLPILSNILYESDIESRMIMVFNSSKKLIKVVDYHPEKFKLKKGDYTIRVQIRHDSIALLSKFKNYPLTILHTLSKPLNLKLYKNINGPLSDTNKQDEKVKLNLGKSNTFVLSYLTADGKDLPKEVKAGDRLVGKLHYQKADVAFIPLTFLVSPSLINVDKPKEKENKADKRSTQEKYNDFLVDQQISYLKKLKLEGLPFVETLVSNNPNHLGALQLKLELLTEQFKTKPEEKQAIYASITEVTEKITQLVNVTELALHYGTQPKNKTKNENEESELEAQAYQLKCKEMDKKRDALVASLQSKLDILLNNSDLNISDREQSIKLTMKDLRQWIDPTEKCLLIDIQYDIFFKQYSVALQKITKSLSEVSEDEKKLFDLLISLTKDVGFTHWHILFKNTRKTKYPDSYVLF